MNRSFENVDFKDFLFTVRKRRKFITVFTLVLLVGALILSEFVITRNIRRKPPSSSTS